MIQTIRLFLPFTAEIPRRPEGFPVWSSPLPAPLRPSWCDAISTSQEFNMLVGNHNDKLEFLISAMTVDLGIHIESACSPRCGMICIENMSSDVVIVQLNAIKQMNLVGTLGSEIIPRGGRIEIAFTFEDVPVELPMMSWLTCEIVATSKEFPDKVGRCNIWAFVKRAPLCVIIEPTADLFLKERTCTIAPSEYRTSIQLKHILPDALLSARSIGFSLSSGQDNQTEAPTVKIDPKEKTIDMQFPPTVTG
jgi:hypothetical protein